MSTYHNPKVAITGHTKGIGLAITQRLRDAGFTIDGFSRSNGYDIVDPSQRRNLTNQIIDNEYDYFINNAYPTLMSDYIQGFAQVDLLNSVWKAWHGKSKTIINIGSESSDIVKSRFHPYSVHKKALVDTCLQLRTVSSLPHVALVKPGYVDTALVSHINALKIDPHQVAEIVYYIICSPVKISEITFSARDDTSTKVS